MIDHWSTRLNALQTAVAAGNTSALAKFWAEIEQQGTPIIQPMLGGGCHVMFFWRGDDSTKSVDVIQDWGADGIREHSMTHLQGTDVWCMTRFMPSDTRTTYQLAPDPMPEAYAGGAPFIPDPLNPNRFLAYADESGFKIWFSSLVLPDAPAQPWVNANVPAGKITLHTPFEDGRRIWVYMPDTTMPQPYSLLVTFDGLLAAGLLGLPKMLDLQIAEGKIHPTVAVMIDNPDRNELMCVPEFADYVAQKIIGWVRETFPVTQDSARTVISGASYGGLCAAYLGLRYPNVFGAVLSQTGWFRWCPDYEQEHMWLAREFIANPKQAVRFYLDVGILENARMLDEGPSQLAANRHMRDVLRAKGYDVIYREYSGGHDYGSTQNPLFDALSLMLG
jgi:enterochelin esterase-like enzyme